MWPKTFWEKFYEPVIRASAGLGRLSGKTDPDSYDERTAQRELFTAAVAPDIQPESAELAEDGTSLLVCWPGTVEPSCYTTEFLHAFAAPEADGEQRCPQSWHNATLTTEAIRLDYSDVLCDDSGLQSLLETIDQHGFALLANCPRAVPAVERLANKIGYVRETIFERFEILKNVFRLRI